MGLSNKGDHLAMQLTALWRALAVLLAFCDFCLAERVLDSNFGLGGYDFHVHPELSPIIFDDSDIGSVYSANSSWSVRSRGHVLLCDRGHTRLAGGLSKQIT